MCAIVGSSDKEKFLKLIEQNQYRGNTSWSVCQFEIGALKFRKLKVKYAGKNE